MGWATERFGQQREPEQAAEAGSASTEQATPSAFEAPLPQGVPDGALSGARSRLTRYPNLLLALAVVVIVVVVFWPKGARDTSGDAKANTKQPATVRKEGKLTSPQVNSGPEYVANAPEIAETAPEPPPEVEIAPTPPAASSYAVPPPPPTSAPTPIQIRERRYVVVMRAGTPDEEASRDITAATAAPAVAEAAVQEPKVETIALQQPEAPALPLPKGLRIPMRLIDPVQTGTPAFVRVRTTTNVAVSKELQIPAGTEGYIPFVEVEANGRAIADPQMPGFLTVGDQRYELQGSAYGGDRLKGLAGQRIKVKGSGRPGLLKRGINSVVQGAAGAVGAVAGVPVHTGDVFDPYGRGGEAQYIVRVAEGASFTFVVGL